MIHRAMLHLAIATLLNVGAVFGQPSERKDQEGQVVAEIARLGNPNKSESAAAVKALVSIGKPAAPALVKVLSDSRSGVRATAAEAVRTILAADPANAPNWHSEAFWKPRIAQLKAGMPLDEALKILLPALSPAEREKRCEGSNFSGGSGVSTYRLDDYWVVRLYLIDHDNKKLHESPPDLIQSVLSVWIAPPAKYTGEWVTLHVNGQKAHEIQYRDGKYDGTFTAFHDDGSKSYQQHYTAGVCHGTDTGWHRNGKVSYEAQYDHGKQVGTWRWWDENGRETSVQEWEDGKLISMKSK